MNVLDITSKFTFDTTEVKQETEKLKKQQDEIKNPVIKPTVNTTPAQKQFTSFFSKVKSGIQGIGGLFNKITAGLGQFGLAAAGIQQISAIFQGSIAPLQNFETGLANINTLLDETSTVSIEQLSDEILALGKEIPTESITELTDAYYQAISAGVDAAEATDFVRQAGQAAVAGLADTETSVDALTTVTNAYKESGLTAQEASDVLFSTIKAGKTDFNQLASSLNIVVSDAASAGVGFNEVGDAIAKLTAAGVPTGKALNQIQKGILAARQQLGDGAFETRTLTEAFTELRAGVGNSDVALKKLVGSSEAAAAINKLGTASNNELADSFKTLEASQGSTQAAFEKQAGTLANQLKSIGGNIEQLAIRIGQALLPVINSILGFVSDLTGAFLNLGNIIKENESIIKGFVVALATIGVGFGILNKQLLLNIATTKAKLVIDKLQVISTNAVAFAQKVLNAVLKANPIGIVITAISLLVGALTIWIDKTIGLQKAWELFTNSLDNFISIAKSVGTIILEVLITPFRLLQSAVKNVFDIFNGLGSLLSAVFTGDFTNIPNIIKDTFSKIAKNGTEPFEKLSNNIGDEVDNISSEIGIIGDRVSNAFKKPIKIPFAFDEKDFNEQVNALKNNLKITQNEINARYENEIKLAGNNKDAITKLNIAKNQELLKADEEYNNNLKSLRENTFNNIKQNEEKILKEKTESLNKQFKAETENIGKNTAEYIIKNQELNKEIEKLKSESQKRIQDNEIKIFGDTLDNLKKETKDKKIEIPVEPKIDKKALAKIKKLQETLNKEFEDAEIEAIRKRNEKALLEANTKEEKNLALQRQFQSEQILIAEETERQIAETKKQFANLTSAEDKAKLEKVIENINLEKDIKLLKLQETFDKENELREEANNKELEQRQEFIANKEEQNLFEDEQKQLRKETEDLTREEKLQKEIDFYNNILATKKLTDDQQITLEKKKTKAEIELAKLRVQNQKNTFSTIAKLQNAFAGKSKELFNIGKAAAIANTIITTKEAVVEAFKSTLKSFPAPFNFPLAIVAGASALAYGISQVNDIRSQQFAKGGVLKGASHSQGGIQLTNSKGDYFGEAEGGEPILTKGVSKNPKLLKMASDINVLGGGRPFFKSGGITKPKIRFFQDGGIANQINTSANAINIQETVNKAIKNSLSNITINLPLNINTDIDYQRFIPTLEEKQIEFAGVS